MTLSLTSVRLCRTLGHADRKFRHKGLKALYQDDDAHSVPAQSAARLSEFLAALEFADNLRQIATMPGWKLHPLKGSRKGEYSITVTGNGGSR